MSLKQKLRYFFKADQASDEAVELLRMFIIPFSRGMKRASVDDVVGAFFGVDDRKFVYAKALRDFSMPGKYFVAGNRPIQGLGPRKIRKGQTLLLALDRVENNARVEVKIDGRFCNYLLEKYELETMMEWINVLG